MQSMASRWSVALGRPQTQNARPQIDVDSIDLQDSDPEVRGEALAGLAERGDARAIGYLAEHLDADCRVYELDAAEKLASPLLLDALQKIAGNLIASEVGGYWLGRLKAAIAACTVTAHANVAVLDVRNPVQHANARRPGMGERP
ncbi:hypothetical protein [Variovorax boronicumulans]|uniref:hypothetical protein n=1 Tax=Variovorax boronicumulans TaxID=436515 RepID=UPI002475FBD5|nr:hypothetical protein [Variovorax boronicumulans]